MKKIFSAIYFLVMAGVILSLSGCGGGGNSGKFHSMSTKTNNDISSSSYEVKQVAVISSPALQKDGYYRIYSGATLSGMDNAQYYVANIGNETQQATLNLGFSYQPDPNASLVVVNDRTKGVVFAYDPSGTANKWKNGGNVTFTNGRLLRYRSLKINEQSYNTVSIDAALSTESFDVHDEDIIHLVFSDDNVKYPNPDYDPEYELEYDEEYDDDDNLISRIPNNQEDYDYYTRELLDIVSYDYVWHADPDHKDEYYTVGLDDTTEYTWDSLSTSYEDYGYIAHDIKYTDSSLNFIENQTATKDDEQEYVVYYSDDIASAVAEEKGEGFEGPYIFATLPIVQGSTLAEVKALMTHTPEEAYNCPVFHIEDDGVYSLSGTWNGQIRVGDNVSAVLILNGLTVNCPVGPAIVIEGCEESYYTDEVDVKEMMYNVYDYEDNYVEEEDEDEEDEEDEDDRLIEPNRTSADLGIELLNDLVDYPENLLLISDDTDNFITGSNVYRILKPEPKTSATKVNGTDISDQKKLVKMDGAVYSFTSFAIAGGENGTGNLTIKSTSLEGLGSEMHLVIEGGSVDIEAPDDGINVNEDDVSVFTMLGGNLTIKSENGDGIDSNGFVVFDGGTLNITAGNSRVNSAGEAGIDAECWYHVYDESAYIWSSINGEIPGGPDFPGPSSPDMPSPVSPDTPPVTSPDTPAPVTSPDMPPVISPDTPPVVSPDNPAPVNSPDVKPVTSPDNPPVVKPDNPTPVTSPDVPGPTPVVSPDNPAPVNSPDIEPIISPDNPPVVKPDNPAPVTSPDVPGPTPVVSPDNPAPVNSPDIEPVTSPDNPPVVKPDNPTPVTSPDVPGPTPTVSPDNPAPVNSPDVKPVTSPDNPPVVSPDTPYIPTPTPSVSHDETPGAPSITSPDPTPTYTDPVTETQGVSIGTALKTNFNFTDVSAYEKLQDALEGVAGYASEISDLLSNNIADHQPRTQVDASEIPEDETAKLIFPIYRVNQSKIYLFALDIQELLRFFPIGAPIHIHSTPKSIYGTSFYSSATDVNAMLVDNYGNEIKTVPANAINGINVATYMMANTNYSMVLTTSNATDEEENNSGGSSGESGGSTPYNPYPWNNNYEETTTVKSNAPYDADIAYGSLTTSRGTTTMSIGSGSNKSFIVDDASNEERKNVPNTGYIMYLEHKVNTFSAITVGTGN